MEREKDVQEVVEKSKQWSAPLRLRLSLLSTGWMNVVRVGTVARARAVETLWAMEGAPTVSGAGEGKHRVVAGCYDKDLQTEIYLFNSMY